jgi:hypothetical protein
MAVSAEVADWSLDYLGTLCPAVPKSAKGWVPDYDQAQVVFDFGMSPALSFRWRFKDCKLLHFIVYDGHHPMAPGPAKDAALEQLRHAT